MYNKLTRSATTAGTTIRANSARTTAQAPATHMSVITKLARENAAQQKKIAELEATIEQLKSQHDQDLKIIDEDLTQLAIRSAQEKALEATVRDQFIARAVKAEVRATRLAADLAAIKDKQVNRLEQPANMRSTELKNKTSKCQEKQVDRLVHLIDEHRNKQAGKAVDHQAQLTNDLVQLINERCNEPASKAVNFQDLLANGLVQPADGRNTGLRHLINKLGMVRASNVNNSVRGSMLADKLADKYAIPEVLYNQVNTANNKIARYKKMANRIVELLRAHQCRRQLHNQKPKSNLPTAIAHGSAIASSNIFCQNAALGTLADT